MLTAVGSFVTVNSVISITSIFCEVLATENDDIILQNARLLSPSIHDDVDLPQSLLL